MLVYEFAGLIPDTTFRGTLEGLGVPVEGYSLTTRRYDADGNIIATDQPLAIYLPLADASHLATVDAAYAAHVPFHNHVANKQALVRQLARRKVNQYIDGTDLTEAMMFMLHVLWKLSQSQALTAPETARLPDVATIRDDVMAIRAAAVQIIGELAVLTDAEAGAFDIHNHAAWPAL